MKLSFIEVGKLLDLYHNSGAIELLKWIIKYYLIWNSAAQVYEEK